MENSKFYLVATPIGNMKDITFHAVEVLKEVDFILAEDTRVSGKLLKYYEIKTKMISYNSHSSDKTKEYIFSLLREGKSLALISDAGTPTISDPGVKIVSQLYKEFSLEIKEGDLEILPIPGASAVLSALSVSGIPASEFIFMVFCLIKKEEKQFLRKLLKIKKHQFFMNLLIVCLRPWIL